ncbi:hypothetical protein [Pseudomonas congelans]|uniref:hypothetical protein n=1 Tax=Pseudomonas congelans TaxID=200452 RepID=UPI001F3EABF9|nr:hypothetical protein [Pseudomonas congelans]
MSGIAIIGDAFQIAIGRLVAAITAAGAIGGVDVVECSCGVIGRIGTRFWILIVLCPIAKLLVGTFAVNVPLSIEVSEDRIGLNDLLCASGNLGSFNSPPEEMKQACDSILARRHWSIEPEQASRTRLLPESITPERG